LKESFEKLRAEVDRLDPGDEAGKARLDALLSDLERKLADPGDVEHHRTLTAHVKEAIDTLGVEYPGTTAILNHIMVTLSNMGI